MKLIYIDGDNNPGEYTMRGLECLKSDDIVKIYYASGNTYYRKEKNRENFAKSTSAAVSFREISAGKNAVDFAVAMSAVLDTHTLLQQQENAAFNVYLVSSDNHFKIISATMESILPGTKCFNATGIIDVLASDPLSFENLGEMNAFFVSAFGNSSGNALYSRAKALFRMQFNKSEADHRSLNEKSVDSFYPGLLRHILHRRIM